MINELNNPNKIIIIICKKNVEVESQLTFNCKLENTNF